MSAHDNNPNAAGTRVVIAADSSLGRRTRAAQIRAAARAYQRTHGVTLTLISKSYDEMPRFLSRSAFTYEIGRG